MGFNGEPIVWLQAMASAAIVAFVVLVLASRLALKVWRRGYEWRRSSSLKVIVFGVVAIVALLVVYRVDSHPLWVARADAERGFDYFVDASGAPEILSVDRQLPPVFWSTDRPDIPFSPTECAGASQAGRSIIRFRAGSQDDLESHFEQVRQLLELDGWETFVTKLGGREPTAIDPRGTHLLALRDDKNLFYVVNRSNVEFTDFELFANWTCRSLVERRQSPAGDD